MFKKIIGIIALVFTLAIVSFGQTGVIKGRVLDQQGAVVVGATVNVRNLSSGAQVNTETATDGIFLFENMAEGEFLITVDAVGFSFATRKVKIDDLPPKEIEIVLSVGNISAEVTVTATRTQVSTTETAVPVSVIDRESLERANVNTPGDALRNLPGVSTVNEGSFQVRPRIRGLDSNRILVLVDGERLNNARTSTTQSGIELGLVGTEQIETIEVIRGAGSVLYGTDALGGTINIITKEAPRRTQGGFDLGASFNGFYSSNEKGRRGSISLTGSGKFFSFRVAQSLERYDNYTLGDPAGPPVEGVSSDGEVLNSQSHGGNTQITTRFFFNDDNDLRLNYSRRRAGNIGVPTLVGVFNAFFPDSDRDKFNARFETRNVSSKLARVSASFYFQNQKRNFSNILFVPPFLPFFPGIDEFSETITDTDSFGFDLQSSWILGQDNFLIAGFSQVQDKNKDSRLVENRLPVFTQDTTRSVPDANFGSFAMFVQDSHDFTDRLKVVGGIRVERFYAGSSATEGFGLPSSLTADQIEDLGLTGLENGLDVSDISVTGDVGAVIRVTDEVSLSGKIGRSFRVPNLFERFFTGAGSVGGFVVGNPTLEPESGVNVDASIKVRNSSFAGSFTYFNNRYKNFLSNIPAVDRNGVPITLPGGQAPIEVFQTQNIGRARIQGFEADIQVPLKLGMGFLTPGGSLSYLRGDNLDTGEPLNTITPLKTVLSVRWQNLLNNYYVDWITRIVNKQERLSTAFLNTNGPEPGFSVSELGGGYVFKRESYRLSLNVGIKNLFDRRYREQFVFAPARGRSYVFGSTFEIK
ncbi:MAG: TonB-dependent receptor [Acidobacteriota bacterium]|nr:TonB-dependent receptor [Acidobacteriota bacterium]MDH3530246.1 TonB-dependent receptor [Acidobacteriota bacterium]